MRDWVEIETAAFGDFVKAHPESLAVLDGLCPKRGGRFIQGRTWVINNDLRLALENVAGFTDAKLGVVRDVRKGGEIVGWGLAYADTLSIYVAPEYRRRGYGLGLALALRRVAGDVLIGGSPAGIALQQKIDRERPRWARALSWFWRRRPSFSISGMYRTWGFEIGYTAPGMLSLHFLCWCIYVFFRVRRIPGIQACKHGVPLELACEECKPK